MLNGQEGSGKCVSDVYVELRLATVTLFLAIIGSESIVIRARTYSMVNNTMAFCIKPLKASSFMIPERIPCP